MSGASNNHGYLLVALQQACNEEDIAWIKEDAGMSRNLANESRPEQHHTLVKGPNPKKIKKNPTVFSSMPSRISLASMKPTVITFEFELTPLSFS